MSDEIGLDGRVLPDCPFCGGRPCSAEHGVVLSVGSDQQMTALNSWTVTCKECGATITEQQTMDDASTMEQIRARVEGKWRRRVEDGVKG